MEISYKSLFKSNKNIKNKPKKKKRIFNDIEKTKFKELFDELKESNNSIKLDKWINFYKNLNDNSLIFDKIVNNLQINKEYLNFEEFINLLEEIIGNFENEKDLNIVYNYLLENKDDKFVSKSSLINLIKELNLNLTKDQIEDLIRIYNKSYDNCNEFGFTEFKNYYFK